MKKEATFPLCFVPKSVVFCGVGMSLYFCAVTYNAKDYDRHFTTHSPDLRIPRRDREICDLESVMPNLFEHCRT